MSHRYHHRLRPVYEQYETHPDQYRSPIETRYLGLECTRCSYKSWLMHSRLNESFCQGAFDDEQRERERNMRLQIEKLSKKPARKRVDKSIDKPSVPDVDALLNDLF